MKIDSPLALPRTRKNSYDHPPDHARGVFSRSDLGRVNILIICGRKFYLV